MRHLAWLLMGAVALPMTAPMPAAAGLSGQYTITFYFGPNHEKTGHECVEFTNTGTILGFPDSGTWSSPTDPEWGGNFVVEGSILRWYGTYNNGADVTNFYNHIVDDIPRAGSFEEWHVSSVPITAWFEGTSRVKAGCDTPLVRHYGDPARTNS